MCIQCDHGYVCLQYDPQATGVIDYQALMQQLLHSDYYALYLGTVDNTQNTLDATATFSMITNLKSHFTAQGRKMQQVGLSQLLVHQFANDADVTWARPHDVAAYIMLYESRRHAYCAYHNKINMTPSRCT